MTVDLRGAAYAASRISSTLKGTTKQFGWLQAPATKGIIIWVESKGKYLGPHVVCRPETNGGLVVAEPCGDLPFEVDMDNSLCARYQSG
jgi:hypothetical protein